MSEPIIAACKTSDLSDVVDLVNAAYRSEGGWTNEVGTVEGDRITLELLAQELAAAPRAVVEGLWIDGILRACVRLDPAIGADGESLLYVGMLAVRPGLQDQGLGRRLLDHAEATAVAQGRGKARISVVFNRESLIAWYERRGYVRTGDSEPFHADGRYGVPQSDGLKLVVLEKTLA